MTMHTREVAIGSPCHVDWASMTKREAAKRFCDACKKHVHDLSAMTENEARALLASPATEGLCVRTFTDARGELVFRPDVPVSRLFKSPTSKAALRAMMVLAPMSLTACMGAMEMPPRPPPPTPTVAPTSSASTSPSGSPAAPSPAVNAPR